MVEVVPDVLVEAEVDVVGKHAGGRRGQVVGDFGRGGHDRVVAPWLPPEREALVLLVEPVTDLMAGAAQERTGDVALLLVCSRAEVRRVGGGVAVVAVADRALARCQHAASAAVEHRPATATQGTGYDEEVEAPLGI